LTYSQNRTNVADLPIHISNCSTARGGPHVEHFEFRNSPQTSSLH
jgi:hypothetical protein